MFTSNIWAYDMQHFVDLCAALTRAGVCFDAYSDRLVIKLTGGA